jgi:leucyl aminopeptidase
MEIKAQSIDLTEAKCDLLVVNQFEGVAKPAGGTGEVDRALDGLIQKLTGEEKFKAKFGETLIFHTHGMIPAKKVMILGLGDRKGFDVESVRKLGGITVNKARDLKARSVVTILHGPGIGKLDLTSCSRALTEGAMLANYRFLKYKKEEAKKVGKVDIEDFTIAEINSIKKRKIQKGIELGIAESNGVIYARDLVNEPAMHLLPKDLVERAQEIVKGKSSIKIKIYDRPQLEKINAWALLGVAMGSVNEPYMIHMRYRPKKGKPKKRIALVGKGLTFDSGGLNLKPEQGMSEMKIDMAGAASVLGIFSALDVLQPKVEVHGIIGACENMPSGSAVRPGDVITSMSGKTIEINNTDAEGRVTMADTLFYANKQKPDQIIDLATLTGAVIVALGSDITGIMGNDQKIINQLIDISKYTGEKLWQLPLDKEYAKRIKGKVGDVNNIGGGRTGGAIFAGLFLQEFIGTTPWVHMDIAGTSYAEKPMNSYTPIGGTGVGVRLLLHYLDRV